MSFYFRFLKKIVCNNTLFYGKFYVDNLRTFKLVLVTCAVIRRLNKTNVTAFKK